MISGLQQRWWLALIIVLVSAAILAGFATTRASDERLQPGVTITVSAAADLMPAFEELGKRFEEQTGVHVDFNFGSTGQLAQQIEAGAPVDLFAAANVSYVDQLEAKGLIVPGTKALYARGRIVIWTRSDSNVPIESVHDLLNPEIKRIAIANPDHAPYGIAAREAMQSAGIWDAVQDKLVLGENVRDTLRYAETGDVDVAIVALSLAIQGNGRWTLIPQELHKPIDQALAVIKDTKHEAEARAFAEFINSDEGRKVMRRYGFILPGESVETGTPVPTVAAATPGA
ncbi:MAG: molybdate ABC transporter substrate-binding protein [Thermomicrobiales bacterium]|nr:MAG: molybdate ABC transporter substrate-binding protein [Thermomicrobiales bacterium]